MKILNYEELQQLDECVKVEEKEIEELHDIAKDMIETCIKEGGIGLAAPQVGINKNFFIYSPDGAEFFIVINPVWFPLERKKIKSIEQCLSLNKEDYYYVERFKSITVKYFSLSPDKSKFVEVVRRLSKDEAVVFQHEADHLKGITLIESGRKL